MLPITYGELASNSKPCLAGLKSILILLLVFAVSAVSVDGGSFTEYRDSSPWTPYCGIDNAALVRNLEGLTFAELVRIAASLIPVACQTERTAKQASLDLSRRSSYIATGKSSAPIPARNVASASHRKPPYDDSATPQRRRRVDQSQMALVPDVDNTTFAALQQIYQQNCGPECAASYGCFPPQGVVRPVCGNTAWSFGAAGTPQCDQNGNFVNFAMCLCGLQGPFPLQVTTLTALTALCLGGNSLTGSIPSQLTALHQMQYLVISANSLTGALPVEYSTMTALTLLDISRNAFSGSIPSQLLLSLTQLRLLDVSRDGLVGSVPSEVTALRLLQHLNLDGNALTGTLPDLSALGNLVNLYAGSNVITGPLPASFTALTQLQVLDLSNNPIGGSVPTMFFTIPALQQLSLANISLTGSIPSALVQAKNLTILDLGENELNGTLPFSLCEAPSLYVVLLSGNRISGSVPYALLDCAFSTLDVRNNLLTGTLPGAVQSLGDLSYNIAQLLLDNNQISGVLPEAASIPPISILSLANNSFEGEIEISSYCMLSLVNLEGNRFSGPLPDFSQCDSLQSVNFAQNSALVTSCSPQQALQNASSCLPPFLAINRGALQQYSDHTQCATFTGSGGNATLQISMDFQRYLYGAQCTCQQEYYWPPQLDNVTGLTCVACPTAAAQSAVSWCQCVQGSLTSCYAVQNSTGQWAALECPYIASPYATACSFRSVATTAAESLARPGCTDSVECQCAIGYTNRRCAQCSAGYFASGRACSLCNPALKIVLPIVYVIVLVVFFVYLLKVQGSSTGALKIASFYGQSLLVVVSNAGIPWPAFISSFLQSSSQTGSLSLTALECVFTGSSLQQRYGLYMATPALLVVLCLLIYIVRRRRCSDQVQVQEVGQVFVFMVFSVLLTTYFDVAVKTLSAISCTLHDAANKNYFYLSAYPWIACDASSVEYSGLLAAAVIGLLVYMLGVPAAAFTVLVRAKTHGSGLQSEENIRRLGFIYGCYRPSAFLWEAVLLVRRLLLAVALTVVPFTSSELTVVIIVLVLVISIALQHSVQPFASVLENRLEQLVLYVLLVTFLGVYVSQASALTANPLEWLPTVLIVLNIVTAVVLGVVVMLVLLASAANGPLVTRVLTRIGFPIQLVGASLKKVHQTLNEPLLDDSSL